MCENRNSVEMGGRESRQKGEFENHRSGLWRSRMCFSVGCRHVVLYDIWKDGSGNRDRSGRNNRITDADPSSQGSLHRKALMKEEALFYVKNIRKYPIQGRILTDSIYKVG